MRLRALLLLAALAMVLAGCRPGDRWAVEFGATEGFAGGGEGYRVASNGTVQLWRVQQAGQAPERLQLGRTSGEALRRLAEALQDPDLARIRLARTGRMTSTLQITVAGEAQRFWWAPGTDLPPALERVLAAGREAVAAAGVEAPAGP